MPHDNSFERMSYVGRDGLTHQSTNLDYSEKTKIATTAPLSPEELQSLLCAQTTARRNVIERILTINPALAGKEYEGFVNRLVEEKRLEWNTTMVADPGMPLDQLQSMVTILENRNESFPQ